MRSSSETLITIFKLLGPKSEKQESLFALLLIQFLSSKFSLFGWNIFIVGILRHQEQYHMCNSDYNSTLESTRLMVIAGLFSGNPNTQQTKQNKINKI